MASNISEEPEIVINVEQQEEEEHTINIGVEQAHPEDASTPIVPVAVSSAEPDIIINSTGRTNQYTSMNIDENAPKRFKKRLSISSRHW